MWQSQIKVELVLGSSNRGFGFFAAEQDKCSICSVNLYIEP